MFYSQLIHNLQSWAGSKNSLMSFKNIENNSGDRLSPCLTPIIHEKLSVSVLFTETHDFADLHIINDLKKFPR